MYLYTTCMLVQLYLFYEFFKTSYNEINIVSKTSQDQVKCLMWIMHLNKGDFEF